MKHIKDYKNINLTSISIKHMNIKKFLFVDELILYK